MYIWTNNSKSRHLKRALWTYGHAGLAEHLSVCCSFPRWFMSLGNGLIYSRDVNFQNLGRKEKGNGLLAAF